MGLVRGMGSRKHSHEEGPGLVSTNRHSPVGQTHSSLGEVIAGEVKKAIVSGKYRPGDRLIEEELAAELGVSRNPVREALRVLEGAGFVEIVPRRGASVAVLTIKKVRELFEVRAALEAVAARLAAERISPDQLDVLEDTLERGTTAAANGRFELLPALNTEFHSALVAASGNERMAEMIGTLRDTIQWVYSRHITHRAADSWSEHRRLFEAVANRDPEAAAHLALSHIAAAEKAYVQGEEEVEAAPVG
jgi:DNA-binding GntR family transcriptional regulator